MPSIRVGNLDIAYDVRGKGEPLLLIPGLSMRRVMWSDEFCEMLVAMGFEVVRFDPRDSGESSRFPARPPNIRALMWRSFAGARMEVPYTLEDMANDAFAVMTSLGHQRFHVAGASMGGMIAQTMAIEHSERLLSLTSIMSGPGGRRYAIGKLTALRALLSPMPRERSAQIDHMVATFRVLHGDELPFEEERVRALAEAQCELERSPAAVARQLGAIFESSQRRRARLRDVRTPALVIHGASDPLLPLRGGVATARHIPGAELMVIPKMGHDLPSSVLPLVAGAIGTHARRAALA